MADRKHRLICVRVIFVVVVLASPLNLSLCYYLVILRVYIVHLGCARYLDKALKI